VRFKKPHKQTRGRRLQAVSRPLLRKLSAPLSFVAETPLQEMVVAALECFYKHNAKANRKKTKYDEINKHLTTGARMRATIVERQTSVKRDPTLS
jgi:hypothetical protein